MHEIAFIGATCNRFHGAAMARNLQNFTLGTAAAESGQSFKDCGHCRRRLISTRENAVARAA